MACAAVRTTSVCVVAAATTLVWPAAALAHTRGGEGLGLRSGLLHPVSGLDHVLAMIAVGVWGAQLGAPAIWLLPVTFPMVMALGGMLGLMGINLPGIEVGIAVSAVALGFAVCREARPTLWVAATLVGFFAVFHGYAHGNELPSGANGLLYSIGFVVGTGTLHACGIALGLVHRWRTGRAMLRAAGAVIALAGMGFLWRAAWTWTWIAVALVLTGGCIVQTSTSPSACVTCETAASDGGHSRSPGRAPAGMVWVPGGFFWMGSDEAKATDTKPRHRVYVDGFWMDQTEVSNARYATFAKATGHTTVASIIERPMNHPVVNVAYEDALTYCKWKGRRLPTEAEFALADRAGADVRRYGFNEWLLCAGGDCNRSAPLTRSKGAPGTGTNQVGFRCVLDAEGAPTR
jgi:urease accessory protein